MSSPTDADSFVALCKQLRELGAVKIEGHGYTAVFVPQQPAAAKPFTPPKQPIREAPLSDADARELLRQRELGLV